MDKLFRQVNVNDREPEKYGYYDTNVGNIEYSPSPGYGWQYGMPYPDYWLEKVELPSDEEIKQKAENHAFANAFKLGANYILNTLKGEKR